jgi:tol-pal system protein YbgF
MPTSLSALLALVAPLLLSACAPARPASRALEETDAPEALRLSREARLELQTQSARLQELEGQVRDLAEMIAWSAERNVAQERALDSLRARRYEGDRAAPGTPATRAAVPLPTPPAPSAAAPESRSRVTPDEATAYRKALDLHFARQYAPAVAAFRDLLAQNPRGAYAGNAEYWIGEGLYAQGDHAGALAAFQRVFAHAGSAKADDAQLKLGYCHLRLGDNKRAAAEFRKLVSLHPSSEYVERARGELEKMGEKPND